ncbi:hypothetical protein N7523_010262 [Penicillium sp. IBT 18751x]|nr:hypothetical protein N7523_010262 [Penicillium sp. IBT 18751x]
MSKMIYTPWSSAEEDNLLVWLSQHQHLSWDDKSKEYLNTFGHYRSPESLRGKQNQLIKGVRRQRFVSKRTLSELRHMAVHRTRRRRRRKFSGSLDSPSTRLGAHDPQERLQQQDSSHVSPRPELLQSNPTERTNPLQSPDGTRSVSQRLWNLFDRVRKAW